MIALLKVAAFDLGTEGAVVRAKKNEDGTILPLSCETWKLNKHPEDKRYHMFWQLARSAANWADVVAYELVQFNRGRSTIPGMRAILLAHCQDSEKFCAGVNVATLKKFAIKGRWSDKARRAAGKEPLPEKKKMQMALLADYPEFLEFFNSVGQTITDDLIDAAWVAIWLLTTAKVK